MKKFPSAAAMMLVANAANAGEAYTYACEIVVDLRFETHLVRIDEQKKTLKWRGKTYHIIPNPECGKYGWHVTGSCF
jgi:hypothetical protein